MGRRLAPWLAGIVAVLLVVGGTFWLSHRGTGPDADLGADATVEVGPLPDAKDGYRWVSWRNVAVQVPETWAYGYETGDQWCVGDEKAPPKPFVAYNQSHGASTLVGCPGNQTDAPRIFGPAPERLWATHLTFQDPGEDAGDTATYDGWTLASKVIDGVEVRLLSQVTQETQGIMDSARTFGLDENGCAPSSSIQAAKFQKPSPAYDVRQVESVDSISVCQYQRADMRSGAPALMGSRLITGRAATDLLHGLQKAPVGGGPDRPQNCVADEYGEDAVELLLHTGEKTHSVYLYYDWCFGNGTTDGTTLRALTADTCAPVFGEPVVAWSYQSNLGNICSDRS
jgi:hypothetical protein